MIEVTIVTMQACVKNWLEAIAELADKAEENKRRKIYVKITYEDC